jgi:hypothetical protein
VLAAGGGTRFGAAKQFAAVGGVRAVDRAVGTARSVSDGLVVVLPPGASWDGPAVEAAVHGGATRAQSVRAGLAAVPVEADVVLVHDAAHPLADRALFARVLDALTASGADAALPVVPLVEALKQVDGDLVVGHPRGTASSPPRRRTRSGGSAARRARERGRGGRGRRARLPHGRTRRDRAGRPAQRPRHHLRGAADGGRPRRGARRVGRPVIGAATIESKPALALVLLVLGTAAAYWALDHPRWEVVAVAVASAGVAAWTLHQHPVRGRRPAHPLQGNGLTAADLLCGPAVLLGLTLCWRSVRDEGACADGGRPVGHGRAHGRQ